MNVRGKIIQVSSLEAQLTVTPFIETEERERKRKRQREGGREKFVGA